MAVNVTLGSPVYNKAPKPAKTPPAAVFPTKLELQNGGEAFLSIPFPDKLHFSGEVLPEHFMQKQSSVDAYATALMASLASGIVGPVSSTWLSGKVYRKVQISVGASGAPVWFELRNAPAGSAAAHRLIVQCNPNHMNQDGMFDLMDRLHHQTGVGFKVGAFLAGSKISRVDIAVDIVGVSVPDLLATVPKPGKQVLYNGGELETVAIHRQQKSDGSGKLGKVAQTKPLGDLLVQIYDKRREQLAKGIQPTFGDAPVTRIEVSKKRFGNKPCRFVSLAALKNPLAGLRIGLVMSAYPSGGWQWLRYAEIVRACGASRAAFVCGLSEATRKQFEKRYAAHPSDVLDPANVWSHWGEALGATGLIYMIEAAEQLSDGVPLPSNWITELNS